MNKYGTQPEVNEMRFYEFADLQLDEDLETALDMKKKNLDNQRKIIANRTTALKIRKARQTNQEIVRKLASRSLQSG